MHIAVGTDSSAHLLAGYLDEGQVESLSLGRTLDASRCLSKLPKLHFAQNATRLFLQQKKKWLEVINGTKYASNAVSL